MRINYITNLDVHEHSGGWSGMNHHIWNQLGKSFDINLIQNVNPPMPFFAKLFSKLRRVLGLRGAFTAFKSTRLRLIAKLVESSVDTSAELNFFHGSTPWMHVKSAVPYALYLDCCFASYINVYHNAKHFSTAQLNNLFKRESEFLSDAVAVFFSSKWAMNDAKATYNLKGSNFVVAGLGAGVDTASAYHANRQPYFLFVALDFLGKGGDKVVSAYREIQKQFPSYSLKIAGEQPPQQYLASPNIEYVGRFSQSRPGEKTALASLFCEAFCFVLPTSKDMTPLVLIEALSAGCPVISVNRFGIPEIVKHQETGLLIDGDKLSEDELVNAMSFMITDRDLYKRCSANARESIASFTWDNVGQRITSELLHRLS